MLKIMNLNIWNYNEFDRRKGLIVELIRRYSPDIVAFQEIRDDSRKNKRGNNQLKQLNGFLNYPYMKFFRTMDVNAVNKALKDPKYDPSNPKVYEGLGVLSKFRIVKSHGKMLRRHPRDKYTRGILYLRIKAEKPLDMVVVHYSADDLFSKLHLKETLEYAKKMHIEPIIIGDFNIRDIGIARKLATGYVISKDRYDYCSYPAKGETLDYVFVPRKHSFVSFQCIDSAISDHRALLAEIRL